MHESRRAQRGQPAGLDRQPAPGARRPGASYAIELLPANGNPTCDPTRSSPRPRHARVARLDQGHLPHPLHRLRRQSPGLDHRHLQAGELPRLRLLHPAARPPTRSPTAAKQRSKAPTNSARKRSSKAATNAKIPNSEGQYCEVISFVSGDPINGPLHTNDALVDLRQTRPSAARQRRDRGQRAAAKAGTRPPKSPTPARAASGTPNFVGTFLTNSPALIPPATNAQLADDRRTGVQIQRPGAHLPQRRNDDGRRRNGSNCNATASSTPARCPANGVVYVESSLCSGAYSPFTVTYPATSECGNVYVHGNYSGQLTIAAEQRHHHRRQPDQPAAKRRCSA